MLILRSTKATYVAAFVFGAVLALLLAAPVRAAVATDTAITRLFEVGVHRYVPEAPNRIIQKRYLLNAKGELRPNGSSAVPVAVTIPAEAFDKVLISASAQLAYAQLSASALENFVIEDTAPIMISERMHFEISVSPEARVDVGSVPNLSSRGAVAPGRPLVGGFVVQQEARTVLLRAIGPTLGNFGVAQPLADPVITIFKNNTPFYENDNWGTRFDADQTAAVSARVGAFALPAGSRDAALVVELPPGAYTARVTSADGASGDALVEIYIVP